MTLNESFEVGFLRKLTDFVFIRISTEVRPQELKHILDIIEMGVVVEGCSGTYQPAAAAPTIRLVGCGSGYVASAFDELRRRALETEYSPISAVSVLRSDNRM
jgi:hypothetical protein